MWSLLLAALLLLAVVLLARACLVRPQRHASTECKTEIAVAAEAVPRLAEALRHPTISTPGPLDGQAFARFHAFLERAFPRVTSQLRREVIGECSLLYSWQGSDLSLRPILFVAHQDVVPVEAASEKEWRYPPFSGTVAEEYVWGRGALDIKSGLMAHLEAVEILLASGRSPHRTIYLAYGADEEIKGERGAGQIARLLRERGVVLEFVIDEGGFVLDGIVQGVSRPVAAIGVAEKGYLSLDLVARGDNGHSSMPPRDASIHLLARAIAKIDGHVFPAHMRGISQDFFSAVAPEMSFPLRLITRNLWLFRGLLRRILSASPSADATIRTTKVFTMLQAGIADNVMPQYARATLNLRLFPGESSAYAQDYLRRIVDDERITIGPSAQGGVSEPSDVSSTQASGYLALSAAIAEIFPEAAIAPFLMIGMTDSRHYRDLTRNIYRFAPIVLHADDMGRIHGNNERIGVENYQQMVRFYVRLLQLC